MMEPMKKRGVEVFSNWYYSVQGISITPSDFYSELEQRLASRQIPKCNITSYEWREGGFFSGSRLYLRVRRQKLLFDICGAPFGTTFFFSWWLSAKRSAFVELLLKIPIVQLLCLPFLRPPSFYEIDTAMVYQDTVHGAVLEAVEHLTKAGGLHPLTDAERKPILRGFLKD
jgi:hypothetical protein